MSPLLAQYIGSIAATLTTLSFLPQVVKTWRSGSAADFSWLWVAGFAAGIFLWLIYGLAIGSLPLIGANGLTFALVLTIAFVKSREQR